MVSELSERKKNGGLFYRLYYNLNPSLSERMIANDTESCDDERYKVCGWKGHVTVHSIFISKKTVVKTSFLSPMFTSFLHQSNYHCPVSAIFSLYLTF